MMCGLSGPIKPYTDPTDEVQAAQAEQPQDQTRDTQVAATAVTVAGEPPPQQGPADRRALIDNDATAAVFHDRLKPHELLEKVQNLLDQERVLSARLLARRHIDVTIETLRKSAFNPTPHISALQLLASEYDLLCLGATQAVVGQRAALVHHLSHSGDYRKLRNAYSDLADTQAESDPRDVSAHDLVSALPQDAPVMTRIEAHRLMGIVHMLAGRSDQAVAVLEQGVALAADDYPYESADLQLQLAEVYLLNGQHQQADDWWFSAVEIGGALLTRNTPCCDPIFWQRVFQFKPAQAVWPQELAAHLRQLAVVQHGLQFAQLNPSYPPEGVSVEWLLWDRMGHWYLDRGQARAALVAWHNAERATPSSEAKALARVAQARALIDMGQHSTATNLLTKAKRHDSMHVTSQAAALLSVMQISKGQVREGLTLLRNVAGHDQHKDWPGRADAEADMGLAYLLIGDEEAGLHWLHAAQKRFQATGDDAKQITALRNEASYYEHSGQRGKADEVRDTLQKIESP